MTERYGASSINVKCANKNTNTNFKAAGIHGHGKGKHMQGNGYGHAHKHDEHHDDYYEHEKQNGYYGDSNIGLWILIFIIFVFIIVGCCLWWCCPAKLRQSTGNTGCVDLALLFIAAFAITIFILFIIWLICKVVSASRCGERNSGYY